MADSPEVRRHPTPFSLPPGHDVTPSPPQDSSHDTDPPVHSVNIVKHEQTFEDIREDLLKEYSNVLHEDLSPQDRIIGTKRIEMDTENVKPLHFATPKEILAHMRKAGDKELKRFVDAD